MKHSNSKSWKSINFVKHLSTYSASSLDNPKKSFKVESWTFFMFVPSFFIQNQLGFQKLNSQRCSICFAVVVDCEIMDWIDFKHCMSFITLGALKLSNLKYYSMQIESYSCRAQSEKKGGSNMRCFHEKSKRILQIDTHTEIHLWSKYFVHFANMWKSFFSLW